MVILNREKCVLCGACFQYCPQKAIIVDEGRARIIPELCVGCETERCAGVCFMSAIKRVKDPLPEKKD